MCAKIIINNTTIMSIIFIQRDSVAGRASCDLDVTVLVLCSWCARDVIVVTVFSCSWCVHVVVYSCCVFVLVIQYVCARDMFVIVLAVCSCLWCIHVVFAVCSLCAHCVLVLMMCVQIVKTYRYYLHCTLYFIRIINHITLNLFSLTL